MPAHMEPALWVNNLLFAAAKMHAVPYFLQNFARTFRWACNTHFLPAPCDALLPVLRTGVAAAALLAAAASCVQTTRTQPQLHRTLSESDMAIDTREVLGQSLGLPGLRTCALAFAPQPPASGP